MKRLFALTVVLLTPGPLALAETPEEIRVATMPPVVVQTVPRSGETRVDPRTGQLQVTFSKEMMDGNWSWVQISDDSFPETIGKPSYLNDRRTCVLPVKLEPGKGYVVWLNSEEHHNFKDAGDRPAVPYLLVFETDANPPKRSWGPEQATGEPDTPQAGDMQTAWASRTPDGQQEWLLLEYAKPVKPTAIRVYESLNPGALSKITVFAPDGKEVEVWAQARIRERVPLEDGLSKETTPGGVVILTIPVKGDFEVQRVKLYLDSPAVDGWNEIDAVGQVDQQGGMHWATSATASSTFATELSPDRVPATYPYYPAAPAGPYPAAPEEYRIPDGAVELSHVDNTAEGKRSLGGSGHAVAFERPAGARSVAAIQIFASRYGNPQPPAEDFHVCLLDQDQRLIKDLTFPYAMIARGQQQWYTLQVPNVEVPERFYVALDFNPHQTKGVYLGVDDDVKESHSYVGLPDSGFTKVDGMYDWMIRAYLLPEGDPLAPAKPASSPQAENPFVP